jgi:hypothetical protein
MPDRQIWVSTKGDNSNSGSASDPLKTIQAALSKATNGTDIMVKAGTYTENLRINDNNVSLISADGNQEATIKAASQNASTISGFGLDGVTIKGFEIDGANNSNAIHFGMSGKGFDDPIRNLTIKDNVIYSSGGDGIKVSQAYNVKVVHNSIKDSGGEGIDFVAVNNSQISGNNVQGVEGTAGIAVKGGSSNDDITNNKVWDANVNGISVGGWTDTKWMWPNARGYEAKDLTVTGNEVWDVNKSAILVAGARDSYIAKNYLHPDNDYDAVIWIDKSVATHSSPLYSENITLSGNIINRDDWLRVNSGNNDGLRVSGNKVGDEHASGTAGVWSSAETSGDVAAASGSAADEESSGLVKSAGDELIVYNHAKDAGTAAGAAVEQTDTQTASDTTDTSASDALTKWQALEDASAPVETAVIADHSQDAQTHHTTDGWLL